MASHQRIITYTSMHHDNTRIIAEALAESLGAALICASELTADDVASASLIGFGSGIFFGKHHQAVLACAGGCRNYNGTKSFIFSTAGFPYGLARFAGIDFHRDLRLMLTANGFDVAGKFSCRGYDTYGPFGIIGGIAKGRPNDGDIEKAKAFALQLMNSA